MFKNYVQKRVEKLTKKYLEKHSDIKLVCVAGSVGKTSTKVAIATILSQQYRVHVEMGNHNASLSAPLAIMNIPYPSNIRSPFAWWSVFRQAKKRIKAPADVDIIVQELGSDRPGDIPSFSRYLNPDIAVITGVTPEHMEFFGTLDAVAAEELSLANFSKIAIINRDDIDDKYAQLLTNTNINTYGTSGLAEYSYESEAFSLEEGHRGYFTSPDFAENIHATLKVIGEHNIRPIVGAVTTAVCFGMSPQAIAAGAEAIQPVPGRMNILKGLKDSIIIDDTYNSSPAAASMAIQTLASISAPQRIAILGSMNELGQSSAAEHEKLGRLCTPDGVDWVVTIGDEAAKYLAPAALDNGCYVKTFADAISAGSFVHSKLERGAVVLAKGSEGGIFAEEAIKIIVQSTDEAKKLVRQDPAWLEAKSKFFSKF